jgi:hypothetical protein
MICPSCQEDVTILKFLGHWRSCREEQREVENARMRELAIARLQAFSQPNDQPQDGAA